MDRKKAIIAAATVAGSLLAMSSAYALTSGIVGNGSDDGAGNLTPVLDQGSTETSPTDPAVVQGSQPADGHDDEDRLDDRHDDDEHEAVESHDYEGRDDDD